MERAKRAGLTSGISDEPAGQERITMMNECIAEQRVEWVQGWEEEQYVRILRGGGGIAVGIRRQLAASVYDAEVRRRH